MQTTAQTSAKACTTTVPIIPLLYSSRPLTPSTHHHSPHHPFPPLHLTRRRSRYAQVRDTGFRMPYASQSVRTHFQLWRGSGLVTTLQSRSRPVRRSDSWNLDTTQTTRARRNQPSPPASHTLEAPNYKSSVHTSSRPSTSNIGTKGGEDRTELQLKKPSENRNQHDG